MLWVIYDSVLEVEHLQFVQKFPSEWIKNSTTTFFHTDNFNLFFLRHNDAVERKLPTLAFQYLSFRTFHSAATKTNNKPQ